MKSLMCAVLLILGVVAGWFVVESSVLRFTVSGAAGIALFLKLACMIPLPACPQSETVTLLSLGPTDVYVGEVSIYRQLTVGEALTSGQCVYVLTSVCYFGEIGFGEVERRR